MNFDAFKDAPWFDDSYTISIGGLGNIGSWTALLMSRMGYTLYLYDYDNVETRNIGSQFYAPSDLGRTKERSTYDRIQFFTGNKKVNLMGKYKEDSLPTDIMISCFDRMAPRKHMFERWITYQSAKKERKSSEVNIFIDGRSLAEIGYVYAITSKSSAKKYRENELFEDSEVEEQECSFKSTSHNGAIIAGYIVTVLANHITNKKSGERARTVPYKIEYELPLVSFRTL